MFDQFFKYECCRRELHSIAVCIWLYSELTIAENKYKVTGIHLLSKRSTNEITRHQVAHEAIQELNNHSIAKRHLVIGDFNAEPYDSILTSSSTFNTIFASDIGKTKSHKREQTASTVFVNPSWRLITNSGKVHGTFYFKSAGTNDGCGWSLLDQVIATELAFFDIQADSIRIPLHNSMLDDSGEPNTQKISDHLPIMFTLK